MDQILAVAKGGRASLSWAVDALVTCGNGVRLTLCAWTLPYNTPQLPGCLDDATSFCNLVGVETTLLPGLPFAAICWICCICRSCC